MIKRFLIFLLISCFISGYSWSQDLSGENHRLKTNASDSQGNKKSTGTSVKTNERQPDLKKAKFEVLISTDVDCLLKINGKPFDTINADENKKISLEPGNYKLYAQSVTTGDFIEDNLNVKPNHHNTIAIPLQAAITQREKRQSAIIEKTGTNTSGMSPGGKKITEAEEADPKVVHIVNELASNMVVINAANFKMGTSAGNSDELPEHSVTIKSIYFGKYEVTQQQWETVMGYNPSSSKKDCGKCPVEGVSWYDINTFLTKVNKGRKQKFRLPTEAEWEYAAGKTSGKQIRKISWHYENSKLTTHPVGSLPAGALGIYDLYGNVAEWCSDWYSGNYYKDSPAENPAGPPSGKEKVVRGGSFNDFESTLRSSSREKGNPVNKSKAVGFRLVMEAN